MRVQARRGQRAVPLWVDFDVAVDRRTRTQARLGAREIVHVQLQGSERRHIPNRCGDQTGELIAGRVQVSERRHQSHFGG